MKTIILLFLFAFTSLYSFGEGTKELMPTSSDIACLQIWDNGTALQASRNSFTYNAPADKRLYFRINNLSEHVYFGFGNTLDNTSSFTASNWNNGNSNRLRFRLRSPDGTVYTLNYNNVLIPNSAAGYISNHARAVAGPSQLVGSSGYNALYFKPNVVGEWSIEFNRGSDASTVPIIRTVIKYFDITVASGFGSYGSNTGTYSSGGTSNTGTAILGRLFSKAWELNMMGHENRFEAEMFAYTADSIVLKIDFNGMQPFGFAISCNSTGSQSTGDIAVDRRSRIPPVGEDVLTRPEYRIFLNNPDLIAYPTGVLPTLVAPIVEAALCEGYEIVVKTNSKGFIQVLLDLDGTVNSCDGAGTPYSSNDIYDINSKDRLIGIYAATAGTYSIPWDGLDGCGDLVPTGTDVTVRVRIQIGLTHLPLYDVEGHENGYRVTLVRPTGPPAPNLYWDDSEVGGIAELNGVASPAHTWEYDDNGFGNNKTINTWFYIQESIDQVITFKADNSTFDLSSNNSTILCNTEDIFTFEVVYSESRFLATPIIYTLEQAVPDPNYTFYPYPSGISYINDTGTFIDADGIVKRRIFVTYKVIPVGSPLTLDVQLQFTAAASPTLCPTAIDKQDFITCNSLLPITLLSFSGKDKKSSVLLEWQTTNELDNKGFYVQRSEDGTSFENLTFIEGKGTTTAITEYKFIDAENWQGTIYYRLLQVDNNGTNSTTKVISFTRKEQLNSFSLYPNPNRAGGELNLRGITDIASIKHLQIISITGQQILVNPTLKTTFDGIAIDLPQKMAKGIYIVQFVTNFGVQNYKFVIE